jgi:hypothetical protein
MSDIADALRPYWMPGLNDISGKVEIKLSSWFLDGKYQIYNQIEQESFTLNIDDNLPLLKAMAHDCNRMSIAAFETLDGIKLRGNLPKSRAWLIIKYYYSAFYAAHAILRFLGTSCTQLEKGQTNKIRQVADIYGYANGISVSTGYYKCSYDHFTKSFICKKLNHPQNTGSHEKLWITFQNIFRELSNKILINPGLSIEQQKVSAKLTDICEILGKRNNNWISNIRNLTTYRHEFSIWFPYSKYEKYYNRLFDFTSQWEADPMRINIWPNDDRDLQKFMEVCNVIIAICKEMITDMSERCSTGKSFHFHGPLAILYHMKKQSL